MRRVFRRLIRRVDTTESSVSWFEVLPGDDPATLAERLDDGSPSQAQPATEDDQQVSADEKHAP